MHKITDTPAYQKTGDAAPASLAARTGDCYRSHHDHTLPERPARPTCRHTGNSGATPARLCSADRRYNPLATAPLEQDRANRDGRIVSRPGTAGLWAGSRRVTCD